MPRSWNMLRAALHYRRDAFDEGLKRCGFEPVARIDKPAAGDLLLTWNAYGDAQELGQRFERAGGTWIVAENGALSKEWRCGCWYSLALGAVALTGGRFNDCGPSRWDSWGVDLQPWRTGGELVILAQRGIGSNDVRSPDGWAEVVARRTGGRIRRHPGRDKAVKPLADDLKHAGAVATWSSAAAVQALAMGVPVWHDHPAFVMAGAARPLETLGKVPALMDDEARLAAFRRLAWAMWTLDEIKTGEPIRCLMQCAKT